MDERTAALVGPLSVALDALIRDISESTYAAQWMSGIEHQLWADCEAGQSDLCPPETLDALRVLSQLVDGWCTCEGYIPISEWLQRVNRKDQEVRKA